jgi:hypothetical protein
MSEFLFSEDEMPPAPAQAERRNEQEFARTPRLRTPQRDQIEMHWRPLDELLEPDQVEALKQQAEADDQHAVAEAKRAAQQRTAADRQRRLEEAIRNCDQLQQQREESAKRSGRDVTKSRASTTAGRYSHEPPLLGPRVGRIARRNGL